MKIPVEKSKEAPRASAPTRWIDRARAALAASAWTPIAGKALAYAIGFALLALVGSGRISQWLTPRGKLVVGVPIAEAAAAEPSASAHPAAAPPIASAAADAGAPTPGGGGSPDGGASSGIAPDGKVILNAATEQDLRRLPGVGPTRAKAILALREKKGRFQRIEDLLRVRGIGRRTLARLRPLIRVD